MSYITFTDMRSNPRIECDMKRENPRTENNSFQYNLKRYTSLTLMALT